MAVTIRTEPTPAELEAVYAQHPLRKETILARIGVSRRAMDGLSQDDLAIDRVTEVTDQNHVGGATFVQALGRRARMTSQDLVIDLGCGLGGSARVLADRFGCRVDGVDISHQRVREANELTALVGLERLVHVRRADMVRMRVPPSSYDVVWGQGSWLHVSDKPLFVSRWSRALRPGGRIAFEDAVLRRAPVTRSERSLIALLERDWHSTIISGDGWVDAMSAAGLAVDVREHVTPAFRRYFIRLEQLASRQPARVPPIEIRAWRNAVRAADEGLVGYLRLVGCAPGSPRATRRTS